MASTRLSNKSAELPTQEELGELSLLEEADRMAQISFQTGCLATRTIAELTRTDKIRLRRKRDSDLVPTGCQWALDCEECPWPDCAVANCVKVFAYHSKEGREIRKRQIRAWYNEGKTVEWIANFLNISVHTIRHAVYGTQIYSRNKVDRDMAIARLTKEGKTQAELAQLFQISPRTVERVRHRAKSALSLNPLASSSRHRMHQKIKISVLQRADKGNENE